MHLTVMVTWELESGTFWLSKRMCKMTHVVWPSFGSSKNHRGHGYVTGRARVVNTVLWLSYFVLLYKEIQVQPCLTLNHQSQLLQTLGWEGKHRKFCPLRSSSLSSPPLHQEHILLSYKRNILQIGNKLKSFSR